MDSAQSKAAPLRVGDKPADFSLPMYPEGTFTLSQQAGKTVILYFYPMDDTPGCTKQACSFRDLSPDFAALNAVIYGVSADSLDSHKAFTEKFSLPFPLLTDEEGKLRSRFGNPDGSEPPIMRITYIIDGEGTVRHIIGGEGVTVDDHIAESMEWAKKLAPGAA